MPKVTIIAEKPKQAQAYAEALKPIVRKEGYFEVQPNSIFPDGAYLTWAYGHLIELAKPSHYSDKWKSWSLEALPIKPDTFEFLVKQQSEEQYKVIVSLLSKSSQVVVATDTDREGENIAWSIIEKANATDKAIKRLWINSLEVDAIEEGFRNLKDGRTYYPSYLEAQTRQKSDWLIGMNASQLFTLLLQERGAKETFSVGRVQTPTLFMVYQRENEIKNFVPKAFYELVAEVTHPNGKFSVKAEGKYEERKIAIDKLNSEGLQPDTKIISEISRIESKEEREASPRLYTMSGIQTKANKVWKYSPAKVLELVQGLYEKKLVTYPRTDTPYITDGEFAYLKSNFKSYLEVISESFEMAQPEPQKKYVNAAKVQEHYAIIPTKNIPSEKVLKELSPEELNLYHEVIKNTIAMFHEPYRYNKTIVEVQHGGLTYKTTGKVEISKGWKSLYPTDESKEETPPLPIMDEGDPIQLAPHVKEGKTTKPKKLTEGDLIPLMIHAGKKLEGEEQDVLKETEGIGTEATRANIIETLKNQNYIEVKKNLVSITAKGVVLCEVVDGTLLSSPSLTAKWETFLKRIGRGERDQETFLKGIYTFIDKLIEEMPVKMSSETIVSGIDQINSETHLGKCPNCEKGFLVAHKSHYGCNKRSEGCKQTLPFKLLEKTVSETQLKKLLTKGKTDLIKGFKGKKPFDAHLSLEKDEERNVHKYKFNF